MEKFPNPYDKEYMKMAMLKHEEMFREQVYELHRLYQIQKMLMKNISSTRGNGQNQETRWTKSRNGNSFDLDQPANVDGNGGPEIEEEGELELTLGPSSYYRRRKAEAPLTSDSGLSFSSSSSGPSPIKRGNSGIYRNITDIRKRELSTHKWGILEVPNSSPRFMEEQLREERLKQPPYMFQILSLNVT